MEKLQPAQANVTPDKYLAGLQGQIDARFSTYYTMLHETSDPQSIAALFPELAMVQDLGNPEEIRAAILGATAAAAEWDLMNSGDPNDQKLLRAFQAKFQAYLDVDTSQTEDTPSQILYSRRQVLEFGAAGAGLLLFNLYTQPPTTPTPPPSGGESGTDDAITPAGDVEHQAADVEEEHVEHEHNPDHISRMDIRTASAVTAYFFTMLGAQTAAGLLKVDSIPKPALKVFFGTESQEEAGLSGWTAASLASLWATRVQLLKWDSEHNSDQNEQIASEHAYHHELGELSNLPVAAALVAASEVTSHMVYERRDGHLQVARKAVNELFANGENEITVGGIHITREDFTQFIEVENDPNYSFDDINDDELIERVEDMMINFIDTQKGRVYLEMVEREFSGMSAETLSTEISRLREKITTDTLKMGYMSSLIAPLSLTFTTASMANHSLKALATNMTKLHHLELILEAKEADQEPTKSDYEEYWEQANQRTKMKMNGSLGLVNLSVASAANISGAALLGDPPNIFFALNHGVQEWLHNSAEGFLWSIGSTVSGYNIYLAKEGFSTFQTVLPSNMTAVADATKILANTAFRIAQPLIANKLTGIETRASLFARGRLSLNIDGVLESFPQKLQEIAFIDSISKPLESVVNAIASRRGEDGKNAVLAGKIRNEVTSQREDIEDPVEEELISATDTLTERMIQEIEALGQEGVTDAAIDALIEQMYGDLDCESKETMKQQILNYFEQSAARSDDQMSNRSDHVHNHALGHAARDVRNALGTQLWAVGSLQVVAKKVLGLDKEGMLSPDMAKKYSSIILGIIAGTSAVADNVAAMLFGIDVLEKIGVKTIGESFDQHSDLAKKLRKNAFLMSVFAGSLSKIGNGPNMSIEKFKEIFWNRDEQFMEAVMKPNMLAESFGNTWSAAAVAALLTHGSLELYDAIDEATASH